MKTKKEDNDEAFYSSPLILLQYDTTFGASNSFVAPLRGSQPKRNREAH